MKKQRRNHSQEFKREAVALVVEHGYSCAAAEAEEPDLGGTSDMGRGEIVAPGRFYEVDLRTDPATPPPITS